MSSPSTATEAEYREAITAAAEKGDASELRRALAHLQKAAEGGHPGARVDLAGLVGNWTLAKQIRAGTARQPEDLWARLSAAVDIPAWLAIPAGKALAERPRIATVKRFLSPQICDCLIARGREHLVEATLYDTESAGLRQDSRRNNRAAELTPERSDAIVPFVRARIAALASLPVFALETTQLLHYEVGQRFSAHYDFLDVRFEGHAAEVALHGQRALTLLVYLNENFDGGETAFPEIDLSYKGKKGDALVFWNLTEEGKPDWLTKHVGTPPTRGEKWLLSQWIRIKAT